MTDYAAMISLVHILFAVMLTVHFLQRHRTTSTTPVLPVLPIILYDLLPKGWTAYETNPYPLNMPESICVKIEEVVNTRQFIFVLHMQLLLYIAWLPS